MVAARGGSRISDEHLKRRAWTPYSPWGERSDPAIGIELELTDALPGPIRQLQVFPTERVGNLVTFTLAGRVLSLHHPTTHDKGPCHSSWIRYSIRGVTHGAGRPISRTGAALPCRAQSSY